jgi:hypothetical protein
MVNAISKHLSRSLDRKYMVNIMNMIIKGEIGRTINERFGNPDRNKYRNRR